MRAGGSPTVPVVDPLRLISDQRCAGCAARGALLCAGCRRALPWLRGPLCPRCGEAAPRAADGCTGCARLGRHVATARSALAFEGAAVSLIREWKDRGRVQIGTIAATCVAGAVPRPEVDAIAAVPAARERAAWRGVDGPGDLADALGRTWRLPVGSDSLRRVHERPQRGLSAAERRRNAAGAIRAVRPVRGRILLVDDVMTTGATLRAAAAALRGAGAARVDVITLARVATIV